MNYTPFFFKNQLITALFCSMIAIITSFLSLSCHDALRPEFKSPDLEQLTTQRNVVIVIPAYNEAGRIEKTLQAYLSYFHQIKNLAVTILVVCNNCSDNTAQICQKIQEKDSRLHFIDLPQGGKGFAVKSGFLKALEYKNIDYIGFVDADMATQPVYFHELIVKIGNHDGVNASRYSDNSRIWPTRPFVKRIGGKFYNWMLRHQFHLDIRDTQCGAKLFTYDTILSIAPHMQEQGWAFELELFYLCQLFNKNIVEIPTTWVDVPGSHLTISGCYKEFISAPFRIKNNHKALAIERKKIDAEQQKADRAEKYALKKENRQPRFLATPYRK